MPKANMTNMTCKEKFQTIKEETKKKKSSIILQKLELFKYVGFFWIQTKKGLISSVFINVSFFFFSFFFKQVRNQVENNTKQ